MPARDASAPDGHRGRRFFGFNDFAAFTRDDPVDGGPEVLTSPPIDAGFDWNEAIVSWNAGAPAGTWVQIDIRAILPDHATKWYTLALWSMDTAGARGRRSVAHQGDADGDVCTDTLALARPARRAQVRVTLGGNANVRPVLRFLGCCFANTHAHCLPLPPCQAAWGREIAVPQRSQLAFPDGKGWCSATSTSMVLAHWAQTLRRPELDVDVPATAHAVYDPVWAGTGNWPFNTAFAGSFPGMRAYVTRLSDVSELERWIVAGVPPIVSLSYALLKGGSTASDAGHLVVCVGFTPAGDPIVNDPYARPGQDPVRRVFPRDRFAPAWAHSQNTVYLIYPEGMAVPADPFGHWTRQ